MESKWVRLISVRFAACAITAFTMLMSATPGSTQPIPELPQKRGTPPPTAKSPAARPAKPAPPPLPAINLTMTATATADGAAIKTGLSWRVFPATLPAAGKQAPEPVWTEAGEKMQARLPDGDYVVEARHGLASARKQVTLKDGKPLEDTISLELGLLAARALAAPGGQPLTPALFRIYRETDGGREEIGRSSAEPAQFGLSAGSYILRAESGIANAETPVAVEAGKVTVADVSLNVGALEISTFAVAGAPKLVSAIHHIYPAENPGADPTKALMRVSGGSHSVNLPAGKYRVETVAGLIRQENTVTISPGETARLGVVLNAGELRVVPPIAGGPEICSLAPARLLGMIGGTPLGKAAGPNASFLVPSGSYALTCHPAGQPQQKRKWSGEVKAGEVVQATPQT